MGGNIKEMQMFSRFCVYVFLGVVLLYAGGTMDVHAQERASQTVFDRYSETFRHPDVQEHFPDVLNAFKADRIQHVLNSIIIASFAQDPRRLRMVYPGIDHSIIMLLFIDEAFRALFRDEDFHLLLQSPTEIDRLVRLISQTTPPSPCLPPRPEYPRATRLTIVSGNNQSGEVGKPLAQLFVVGVLDQNGMPLQGTLVTFAITAGNGRLSVIRQNTDVYGQARTTLTLGREGRNSVRAGVFGLTQSQTFTATATAPPSPPVLPVVPPSTSESPLPPMYWIEGNTIYHRPTGGVKTIFPVSVGGTLTGGLAVDTEGKKVYWTERTSHNRGRIQSANLDGSNVQTVKEIIAVPFNIAFDAVNRKLYWTNSLGKIQRINVDGKNFSGSFIVGLNSPKHIAFDVEARRLYWTAVGGIWSIYADNNVGIPRPLGKEDFGEVRGIAVFDDVIYWTEQTNGSGSIRSVNRNGSGDKLLAVTESIPGGIAVDAVGRKVYWTTSHGIQSVPLTGETVVIREEEPAGIALGGTIGVAASPAAPSLSPVVSVENTLLANYPNPFNPETWIPYQLSKPADVSISIYAIDGRLVRRLELGHQSAGVYRNRSRAAYWDGRNEFGERVASGLYFYTLTAGDFTATRRMLIRK